MADDKRNQFLARRDFLMTVSKKIEKRLRSVPEGGLRISSSNKKKKRIQYYHRKQSSDRMGTYIPKSKHEFVRRLAQKGYDQMTIASAKQEIRAIDLYLKNLPALSSEEIYDSLSENRKRLVTPQFETDEMYAEAWGKKEYDGKEFYPETPELYTEQGERVRSKSELIIANILNRYQIPYRYEYPVMLKGFGRVYPDFTILDIRSRKEIIWEHLGMMDDSEYVEKAISKISFYIKNGIFPGDRLIITYETKFNPLNIREIEMLIEHMIPGSVKG